MKIVVSIKPVHSLVAQVMGGTGTPHLLVDGANSPHTYSLKPSDARALERAKLIFWIGPGFERFLAQPIATIGKGSFVVTLGEARGLTLFSRRDRFFPADADSGHGEHEHEHEHDTIDPHIWLDPVNAKIIVAAIRTALVAIDPKKAGIYEANAISALAHLDALTGEVRATLKPVRSRRFIAFHDSYQYFEKRFGVVMEGVIMLNSEVAPGARHIAQLRRERKKLGILCIFSEPQFDSRLVRLVTDGEERMREGVLDPLGTGIENGPNLYYDLIRSMAGEMKSCLDVSS